MTALADLLARLESASEGSADLDGEVLCFVRGWRFIDAEDQGGQLVVHCAPAQQSGYVGFGSDRPTRSLDAAVMLLPHGYAINNMMIWPGCPSTVTVVETREDHDGRFIHHGGDRFWQAEAATAPIAICIACLRAREGG
jgi:hypothetical protein